MSFRSLAPSLSLPPRSLPLFLRPFTSSPARHATSSAPPPPSEQESDSSERPELGSQVEEVLEDADAGSETQQAGRDSGRGGRGSSAKGLKGWLESEGARFKEGRDGMVNWIGDVPFPTNPTFRPSPPLPDSTRTQIFDLYRQKIRRASSTMSDASTSSSTQAGRPGENVIIRELSKQFGVSMDRVRAIIRLKAIEQEMKINGEPLQTHFLNGMEAVLAVKTAPASARTVEPPTEALNMAGKKSIYEFVDEENDEKPVFPELLFKKPRSSASSDASAPGDLPHQRRPAFKSITSAPARPRRVPLTFVDVSETSIGKELEDSYKNKRQKAKEERKRLEKLGSASGGGRKVDVGANIGDEATRAGDGRVERGS